jgi:hypothetical protein
MEVLKVPRWPITRLLRVVMQLVHDMFVRTKTGFRA